MATLAPAPRTWAWWQDDRACQRHLRDLLGAELQALRPGQVWPAWQATPHADLHLRDDLGVDSLELMSLSAAVAQACDLHDPAAHAALYTDLRLTAWADVVRRRWAAHPVTVGFRTSGSTGRPRCVRHRVDALQQEVAGMGEVLQGGPAGPGLHRVVSVVRCHHIYGHLFTLLLPHWPGWRSTHDAPLPVWDAAGLPPAAVVSQLQPGDVVVGFPDWWHAALRCGLSPPVGVVGLTSTAPCPDSLAQAWRDAGLSRMVQIYGSTETAGVAWRDDPQQPYTLMPHWRALACATDQLERLWPTGERSTVALPDHVHWMGPCQLVPAGRVDHAVQVGGVNVQPEMVRQHLLTHPAVAEVAVRLHDFAGVSRLKALVVPREPGAGSHASVGEDSDLVAALHLHNQRLPPAARPAHITVAAALPRTAIGKLADWPVTAAP